MAENVFANPTSAFKKVSDFVSGVDDAGRDIEYPRVVQSYKASTAITKGNWVSFVTPTTTEPLRVAIGETTAAARTWAGVALNTVAAGEMCNVVVYGYARCTVGTTDPVFGDAAIIGASDGLSGVLAAPDATTVAGTILGLYLGVEDAANLAPVFVQKL
jgi:hypothetical protein